MGQNEVKIVLTTDASGAVTGIKTATGEMASFGNTAKDTGDIAQGTSQSVMGLTKSIGALALGIIGVKSAVDVVKGSLSYLGQIETATLGIGTSFMTAGTYVDQVSGKVLTAQASLKAAQDDAKQTMAELQVANFQTIATLDQLVKGYQETLPVAMAKGFDRQQVKDYTVAMVQAAGAIGMSLDQLGEETRSMLTGTINPRTSRIATVLGLTNEDVRQHSQNADQLFSYLMGKLDAYTIAGIEAQNTWGGLLSNTKDIGLQVGGQVFQPLFDSLKYEMKLTLDGLISIDEKTKTIKWNPEFLEGINTFKSGLTVTIAELYRMGMLLDQIGGTMTAIGAIATFGSWDTKMRDWNKMFEERHQKSDQALNDLAMAEQGLRKLTDAEKEFVQQTATLNKNKSLVYDQGDYGMYIKKDLPQKSTFKQTPKDNSDIEFIKKLDEEILKAKREGYDKATALAIEYGDKMAAAEKQGLMAVKKVKEWFWAEAQGLDREQEKETLKEKKGADDKKLKADHDYHLKKWQADTEWQEKQRGLLPAVAENSKEYDATKSLYKELFDGGKGYYEENLAFEMDALTLQYDEYAKHVQDKAALDDWYLTRKQEMQEKLLFGESIASQKRAMFAQAEANVKGVAYRAMENQMLKLIETGKFSVGEMALVVAQQVKIELVGLAAKAAVNALFFTGMGFAMAASGNAASAALYYSAATEMAAVGGAALAGAALVNTLTGPGGQRPEAGQVGGSPINVNDTSSPNSTVPQESPRETKLIIINIHGNVVDHAAFVRELAPYIEEAKGDKISFGG